MGTNNRQRRATKKKARARSSGSRPQEAAWAPRQPAPSAADVRALLVQAVHQIWDDATAAGRCAERLLDPGGRVSPEVARAGVRSFLADMVRTVTTSGWSPSDIVEVIRRVARDAHVPLVVALMSDDASRYPPDRVPQAWRDDLRRAGAGAPLALERVEGMQQALELLAALAQLPAIAPVLPAPGTRAAAATATASPSDAKLLAKVQALLAKAEATEFDEEAEALSAKAQELVSRHALDRLLAQAATGSDDIPVTRRLWIDAPYVFAKSMLVHVVAEANRCRSIVSEKIGACTVVGDAADLDAVEVLVPSLLVQAHVALARFGRQTDRRGTSRTRSFRQSFLLAYAHRIGERLREADTHVAERSGRSGELVPVLARHRERVDATFDELFPETVAKSGTVANATGWAAGRAAADQALLGGNQQITDAEREAS